MAKNICFLTIHEQSVVAQLLTRLSFGFSLGVGVLKKIYLSPTPSEKPNKNLIHTRISLGFSLGVGGYKKNILYPTPNEKPNKNLIHTRISLGFSVGVGG